MQAGYDVVAVGTGLEAVAAAKRDTFDVIVLDVRLPDMDGPEVLAALRDSDPDAPCLVISGHSAFEDAIRCLRNGATDYVRKPFDLETVVRAVDRVLASTHLKVDAALLAASQSIFSSLDAPEISRRVLRVIRSLLRADEASITLYREDQPTETFRIGDLDAGDAVERIPASQRPGDAALLRKLLAIRDPVLLGRDTPGDGELAQVLSPSAHQILAHRLAVGDRLIGLLAVARTRTARGFGERDMRRLMLLAGHITLAFENARLHAETEEQGRKLVQALDRVVAAERIASIGRLSAGIGHEISNPACSVLAYLEVAREAMARGRNTDVSDALDRATRGANSILDVCQALRPLGRGQGPREPTVLDLRRVVDGALLLAQYELRKRARVKVDIPDKLPVVIGDPAKLGQVFLNLLLNAAASIRPDAPEANEVRVRAYAQGDWIIARVEDTGQGVPDALRGRLFEPNVTSKQSGDGHGMGLAICKWIVDEAGGTIRHDGMVERGAAFEIRLPIRRKASEL